MKFYGDVDVSHRDILALFLRKRRSRDPEFLKYIILIPWFIFFLVKPSKSKKYVKKGKFFLNIF